MESPKYETGEQVGMGLANTNASPLNEKVITVDIPKGAFHGLLIDGSLDEVNHRDSRRNRQSQASYPQQVSDSNLTPL